MEKCVTLRHLSVVLRYKGNMERSMIFDLQLLAISNNYNVLYDIYYLYLLDDINLK